jgi:hypothetical protein
MPEDDNPIASFLLIGARSSWVTDWFVSSLHTASMNRRELLIGSARPTAASTAAGFLAPVAEIAAARPADERALHTGPISSGFIALGFY